MVVFSTRFTFIHTSFLSFIQFPLLGDKVGHLLITSERNGTSRYRSGAVAQLVCSRRMPASGLRKVDLEIAVSASRSVDTLDGLKIFSVF